MKRRFLGLVLVRAFAAAIGACEEYATRPVNRYPIITSIVAFPTVLRLGDSTIVTVTASDPDGDTLVYDWEAYNGLVTKNRANSNDTHVYHTSSPSRVFYLVSRPTTYDTAFVFCAVRDVRGGYVGRTVVFTLQD